jgi:phage terminase small subunit
MTTKEISFAENYLCTFNATEAAKPTEYSERSARQIGYENQIKPYIQTYIRKNA